MPRTRKRIEPIINFWEQVDSARRNGSSPSHAISFWDLTKRNARINDPEIPDYMKMVFHRVAGIPERNIAPQPVFVALRQGGLPTLHFQFRLATTEESASLVKVPARNQPGELADRLSNALGLRLLFIDLAQSNTTKLTINPTFIVAEPCDIEGNPLETEKPKESPFQNGMRLKKKTEGGWIQIPENRPAFV